MAYILFISEQKLKDTTAINGSVDMEHILPYMINAQKQYIEPILGTDLFEKLQTDISGSSLTGNYKILVEDYIADALAHYTFYKALPFINYKIQNNSVVSKSNDTDTAISKEELDFLRSEILNTAEYYGERAVEYLKNNTSLFPEYSSNTGADIHPKKTAYYSGMNLESEQNKIRGISLDDFLTADLL
jgi:hypothetical protein